MKPQNKTGTYKEALRLLHASGQTTPPQDRVELIRWILQTCDENGWAFTEWDEPLYPALDSFGDVELLTAIEETFHLTLDEVELRSATLDTLGDLVLFLEPRLSSALHRLGHEHNKVGRAPCPTQAAFYAVRRRLCEAGAAYTAVHALLPSAPLRRLTRGQTERFVGGLSADYGLDIPLRFVVWGWMEVPALTLLILFFVMLVCVVLSDYVPGGFGTAVLIWVTATAAVSCVMMNCGRYKWPKEYRTLGDVARKISTTAETSPQAAR